MNASAQAFLDRHWRGLLGTSYTPEGDTPETGFDCWGFVRHVYVTQGVQLPVDIHQATRLFQRVKPPFVFPDVLVFKLPPAFERHVGVALDDRWFVHCSVATNGVGRCDRGRDFWPKALSYAVRCTCT
jgi:hypothetical protein